MRPYTLLLCILGLMHTSLIEAQTISDATRQKVATTLIEKYSNCNSALIQRGINQVAS